MAETDQGRPLAPVRVHPRSDDEEKALKTMNRRRKIKLCGCVTAILLLLLVIVIVILAFTVFKVKDPKVTTNEIQLTNFGVNLVQIPTPQVKINMTMVVNMSIKNDNIASIKLGNSTTTVYYRGITVADAVIPPGLVKAKKTTRLNVTIEVMADRLVSSPNLLGDVVQGEMVMNTYSIIPGRVKILFIKKHVEMKMNCTMTINISKRGIENMTCTHKVKL
ncbi:putative Late embryogenesis abundant protein, LEA-14 [Medicago truncatula]|uniref:Late embryogenesis abundant protein n=1 Tax=Medicago truncatula TaxID=3880 RepID=A0A072TPL5_MEDTR|nr:late embryogenesis abundant protein [Medicago truncatula]RHN39827.1 putative Late embryogenesis abundant protein, LEA-14 [Medicago truncatula]